MGSEAISLVIFSSRRKFSSARVRVSLDRIRVRTSRSEEAAPILGVEFREEEGREEEVAALVEEESGGWRGEEEGWLLLGALLVVTVGAPPFCARAGGCL